MAKKTTKSSKRTTTEATTTTKRKGRTRAITTILREMEKARKVIAKAAAAQVRLEELETELNAVPAERRERELAAAQSTINMLISVDDKSTEAVVEG